MDAPAATPRALGWRMPAEWAPHTGTWIAWPHNRSDWPGRFASLPGVYCELVRLLVAAEAVRIIVPDARRRREAERRLSSSGVGLERVRFYEWRTDRSWTRDMGPIFVSGPPASGAAGLGLTRWRFNGWAKYDDWHLDNRVPPRIARALKLPVWAPRVGTTPVVLEGGAIDPNGAGDLLATEECLLDPVQARNPGLGRRELERLFFDYLGADRVLWLERGIVGDDTHGHVDDVARFVAEGRVVAAVEPDPEDENHVPLARNLERLRSTLGRDGRPLEVLELPMPAPIVVEGQRLPASYANFYVANERVIVPTFDDPNDVVALGVLRRAFPDRTIVGLYARDLVWGLGTVHCATQPEPVAGA